MSKHLIKSMSDSPYPVSTGKTEKKTMSRGWKSPFVAQEHFFGKTNNPVIGYFKYIWTYYPFDLLGQ